MSELKKHKLKKDDLLDDFLIEDLPEEFFDIDVNKEWRKFSQTVESDKRSIYFINNKQFYTVSSVAAIIIILLGIYMFFPRVEIYKSEERSKDIVLSDGTKVSLKYGSILRVKSNYGRKYRIVKLEGDGYFDVAHDSTKPFIVNTEKFKVEVKGTQFFVSTAESRVAVVEGKVMVFTHGQNSLLTKGDEARVIDDMVEVSQITDVNILSWKTGKLVFYDESLSEIIDVLEDVYNVKIVLASDIRGLRLTATFDNQSISDVLEVISRALDLKITRQGKSYYIYK